MRRTALGTALPVLLVVLSSFSVIAHEGAALPAQEDPAGPRISRLQHLREEKLDGLKSTPSVWKKDPGTDQKILQKDLQHTSHGSSLR
jgi:hypothetical protein